MNNRTDSVLCQLFGFGCQAGTLFTSPDTSFGNGSNSNRESAGVDAQYGTNVTWDYYKTVHGRNGIFGNGTGSFNRVHYGNNYVNAFWDGTKMTYGDGDGDQLRPAGLPRRRRARDVARRHREHRRPDLLRRVRRPQRGDVRHLRHDGRVLRRQRQRPGRLPDRRGVRPRERTPASAGWTTRSRTAARRTAGPPTPGTSTCTTPRASATTSSTCWPRDRARRPSTASRTTARPATARP